MLDAQRSEAVTPTHGGGGGAAPGEAPERADLQTLAGRLVGQRVGRYRIGRPIGRGGTGTVFEAVHEGIGQRAAVKVLHRDLLERPELVRRFFNEARATALLKDEGLVRIFDHGELEDGTLYILMELLEGESLRARLKGRGGRLPLREALRVGHQIAAAAAAAHARGIVHRDLKPDNVFIVPDRAAPGPAR